jgi:hypothetical protein
VSLHPNVNITAGTAVPADVSLAVRAGQGFMTAVTQRGALTPILSQSFAEWESNHGTVDLSTGVGRVAAETYFRIGGKRLWTSRVAGPAPVFAFVKLFDQAGSVDPGDVSLIATATSPGEWANGAAGGLSVEVYTTGVTAGSFVIITRLNGVEVERSPELVDSPTAVAWSTKSKWIRLTLGASSEDPRVAAAANLTGGLDDVANVTEAQWTAALARFTMALGPGIVFAPGRSTAAAHTALDTHAIAFDRIAYKDAPTGSTASTLVSAALSQRALTTARAGSMVGPQALVPGLLPGTTRIVPYSPIAAAVFARNLADGMPIGQASAGVTYGRPGPWVLGLTVNDAADPTTTQWTDTDLDQLHQAGVNVAYRVGGEIQLMGYRTLVDEAVNDAYVDLAGVELLAIVNSEVRSMLRNAQFGSIDAKGQFFASIAAQVIAILKPLWQAGQLYGATEAEAYKVDAGPSVNTPTTIAARQAAVQYAIKSSPTAEQMAGSYIKVATTGSLA